MRSETADMGRAAVRQRILDRIHTLGYTSINQFAQAADVSFNAINEFLKGRRDWPQRETRAKIEVALGWDPGEMGRIASIATDAASAALRSPEPESLDPDVGSAPEERLMPVLPVRPLNVVLDFRSSAFRGLSEDEAEEVRVAAELAALERAREIRAARAGRSTDARKGPSAAPGPEHARPRSDGDRPG